MTPSLLDLPGLFSPQKIYDFVYYRYFGRVRLLMLRNLPRALHVGARGLCARLEYLYEAHVEEHSRGAFDCSQVRPKATVEILESWPAWVRETDLALLARGRGCTHIQAHRHCIRIPDSADPKSVRPVLHPASKGFQSGGLYPQHCQG